MLKASKNNTRRETGANASVKIFYTVKGIRCDNFYITQDVAADLKILSFNNVSLLLFPFGQFTPHLFMEMSCSKLRRIKERKKKTR